MINIGSVKEDPAKEKRISITPETAKKFISLGFIINISDMFQQFIGQ
jgi:NAD/NADP transhydrogenase alpha subunit